MSKTKYVLRANVFGYNDEYYSIEDGSDDGRLCGLFDTREAAMEAWKKLEHETVGSQPLGQVQEFMELTEDELQRLDTFVFEKCGEHFLYDGEYVNEECEQIIAKMNVEDVFEFLTQADLLSYTLVEYQPTEEKFDVLWLVEKETYIFSSEDIGESGGLYTSKNVEGLWYNYFFRCGLEDCCKGEYFHFTGTLEALSHTPEILRTLIANNPKIHYDDAQQQLSLADASVFGDVYPLLIAPPIEVREVTFEQLVEIEKNTDWIKKMYA